MNTLKLELEVKPNSIDYFIDFTFSNRYLPSIFRLCFNEKFMKLLLLKLSPLRLMHVLTFSPFGDWVLKGFSHDDFEGVGVN